MSDKITRREFFAEAGTFSLLLPFFGCALSSDIVGGKLASSSHGSTTIETQTAGPPKASDVIMRSLRIHPEDSNDPHDTMRALEEFHATRLEWAYISDDNFIETVKKSGRVFGGAVSSTSYMPVDDNNAWFERVCIKDLNGEPIIAPWKRTRGQILWGCMNNPYLEKGYIRYLKRYIEAGVHVIQRDEPRGNFHCTDWGGCFCPFCIEAFRKYLEKTLNPDEMVRLGLKDIKRFDYGDYLRQIQAPVRDAFGKWEGGELKKLFVKFQFESTINFHKRTRRAVNEIAGRPIPMSCNNLARNWSPIEDVFDWWIGELPLKLALPRHLHNIMIKATKYGKRQVLTMPKATNWQRLDNLVERTRKTIALAYALGIPVMVPWDIYMPGDTPRYFGNPDEYADLFAFIRSNARYFDEFKMVDSYGISDTIAQKADGNYRTARMVGTNSKGICVVRCLKPEHRKAPRILHLIDWRNHKRSFKLMLNKEVISGGDGFSATLKTPFVGDVELDKHKFVNKKSIEFRLKREVYEATIPKLNPWGILCLINNEYR